MRLNIGTSSAEDIQRYSDQMNHDEDADDSGLSMFEDLRGSHNISDRLEILPLDRADLPLICYIVVDRIAEIITRPLKDFKDLGENTN